MAENLVATESLLVIDVGSVSTRAVLFDVVSDRYRYLATGQSRTTAWMDGDISLGVRMALADLEKITGRVLVDDNQYLIQQSGESWRGVDRLAVTYSLGCELTLLVAGLLDSVSLESAIRLAHSLTGVRVETLSLDNPLQSEKTLDYILGLRPDLIVVAGGLQDGASEAVLQLVDQIVLACNLMFVNRRPGILFVGNEGLHPEVEARLGAITDLHFAANIRPGIFIEQLAPARVKLAELVYALHRQKISGLDVLNRLAGGQAELASLGLGRVTRYLQRAHPARKAVLSVDLGASATTLAFARDDELSLGVYSELGLGASLEKFMDSIPREAILRWLPEDATQEAVLEYGYHKSLHPYSLPTTPKSLTIEQALGRELLREAKHRLFGSKRHLPVIEPIIAGGSSLACSPSQADALLVLLDGLEPVGVTTVVIDQYRLSALMGIAARVNPLLAVQILDSDAFLHLATVITPQAQVPNGRPILDIQMIDDAGIETTREVYQGELVVLPLSPSKQARLRLQPLHQADIGMGGPGIGGGLRVMGSQLGIVIDGRGRPVRLPKEPRKRRAALLAWRKALGEC